MRISAIPHEHCATLAHCDHSALAPHRAPLSLWGSCARMFARLGNAEGLWIGGPAPPGARQYIDSDEEGEEYGEDEEDEEYGEDAGPLLSRWRWGQPSWGHRCFGCGAVEEDPDDWVISYGNTEEERSTEPTAQQGSVPATRLVQATRIRPETRG